MVRNPAPWILLLTIAAAAATFLVVDSRTDDVSGRTQGTAALIVIGVGIAVMVLVQRGWMTRTRRRAAADAVRAAREAAAAGTITDPARLSPTALLAALAIHPIDEQALAERGDRGWAIAELSASPRWTSMKLKAGPDGIAVTRRTADEHLWLYDRWLAEQISYIRGEHLRSQMQGE